MSVIQIVYLMGEVLVAVASIAGNALVLVLICRVPSLQTSTNYFIASLAAVDLLVGAVGIPCALISHYGIPHGFNSCLILNSIVIILTQISVFGLVVIAIERFIAIRKPFLYRRLCCHRYGLLGICLPWLGGLLVGLAPAMGWHPQTTKLITCNFTVVITRPYMVYISFGVGMLLPLILMLFIYVYVFSVVQKQITQIVSLRVATSRSTVISRRTLFHEAKATKWLGVILLLFLLCWAPIHLINTSTYFGESVSWTPTALAILLSHANSAVNPVLYAYTSNRFQQAFRHCILHQPMALPNQPNRSPTLVQHPQFFITAMLQEHVHPQQANPGSSSGPTLPQLPSSQSHKESQEATE